MKAREPLPALARSRPADGRRAWQLENKKRITYFRLAVDPVTCVFTTRSEGVSKGQFDSLNLAFGNDKPEHVQQNLERVKKALDIGHLVTLKQIHSEIVRYITHDRTPPDVLEGDGLFTDQPGLALGIQVADCLPVYLFSTDPPLIGLAHAGWRGTRKRIVERLILAIQRTLGIAPASMRYAFGPCIGAECYEIGPEVAQEFRDFATLEEFLTPLTHGRAGNEPTEVPNGVPAARCSGSVPAGISHLPQLAFLLDLKAANRQILRELGVSEVANLDKCTRCSPDLFYSARRDGVTGRNLAIVYMR